MSKIFGFLSSIMLAIISKHSLNLIWAKADNAVDLDCIDNAGLSPTRNGFDANAEEFGRLGRGEEIPLEVHLISIINFLILYKVRGWGLDVFSLRISATAEWDILRNTAIWWRVKFLSKMNSLNLTINCLVSVLSILIIII